VAPASAALANDGDKAVMASVAESSWADAELRAAPVVDSARPFAEAVVAAKVSAAPDGRAAEAARQVALQISQNASQTDSVIELQLKPEELGALKFRMSLSETGLNIVIQADRPETQDLLRRHIDQLQSQFAALGFGEASVSLQGGDHSNRAADSDSSDRGPLPGMQDEQTSLPQEALPMAQIGVDIRV
jgi:flagellar hook-length control protein FliK